MPEFERSVSVEVDAAQAYAYLSKPENLAGYVATMVFARPEGADTLRVAAEVGGRHEEGEATWRGDPAARRVEWGSPANPRYHGWLQVAGSGSVATVTIHISTDREQEAEEAEKVLQATLAGLKGRLEGT